jgi:hypothetical protein
MGDRTSESGLCRHLAAQPLYVPQKNRLTSICDAELRGCMTKCTEALILVFNVASKHPMPQLKRIDIRTEQQACVIVRYQR